MSAVNPLDLQTRWSLRTRDEAEWKRGLGLVKLPLTRIHDPATFRGYIYCRNAPTGVRFGVMEATGMDMGGQVTDQPDAIWLAQLIAGKATLIEDGQPSIVKPGDIIFGRTGKAAIAMSFEGEFRALFMGAPKKAIDPRLFAPLALRIGHLRGDEGVARIFSGMLASLADVLEVIPESQLRPVELSLTEFLLTSIAAQYGRAALGGAAGERAAHLHRIFQSIETHLGDAGLTLQSLASMEGVSQRYLQKLFTEAGETFINYVRKRRLERCKADLANALYAQQPITQIAFRWGFNSSAHFSRAFREAYDLSPREYRLLHQPGFPAAAFGEPDRAETGAGRG